MRSAWKNSKGTPSAARRRNAWGPKAGVGNAERRRAASGKSRSTPVVNARVALITAQHDRVVASYTLLAAVGGLSMHLACGSRRPLDAKAWAQRFDLRSASALPTSVRCVDRAAQSRRQISRGPSRWGAGCPRGVRECNNNAAFFFARNLPAVAETSEAQGGFATQYPRA